MSMGFVVAICGAFLLGSIAGSGTMIFLYWRIMQGDGLHAFLHGLAKGEPLVYAHCCPTCRQANQDDGLPPPVSVPGCPHCP